MVCSLNLQFNRQFSRRIVFVILMSSPVLSGCITPKQKKDMDEDIFRLQTRVLQLESNVANTHTADQKAGEMHHKNLATTSSDLERINVEVKRMKGDIDALKVGVQTGQMPGQETSQEGSLAAQLTEIRTRLEAVESQQKDLLAAMGNGHPTKKKPSDKNDTPASSANADPDSLKTAFDRKHYKEVAEDAPAVLKRAKGKDKEDVLMMYGESLMKLGRQKEAAVQFGDLIDLKPGDKQTAIAKLRLGDAFKALGDKDTSKLFYEEVSTKYAGTPEGEKAKKALKSKK